MCDRDLGKCPRCGGFLLAFSPAGDGNAACDACCIYWEGKPLPLRTYPAGRGAAYPRQWGGEWSVAYVAEFPFNSHGFLWELAWLPESPEAEVVVVGGGPSWDALIRAIVTGEAETRLSAQRAG